MKKGKLPSIWRMSKSDIEELLKKAGFTNLFWGGGGDFPGGLSYWRTKRGIIKTVNVGAALDARPPNYSGPISDYRERVVVEVRSRKHYCRLGYSFTKKHGGPISFL